VDWAIAVALKNTKAGATRKPRRMDKPSIQVSARLMAKLGFSSELGAVAQRNRLGNIVAQRSKTGACRRHGRNPHISYQNLAFALLTGEPYFGSAMQSLSIQPEVIVGTSAEIVAVKIKVIVVAEPKSEA
jgi:hypothetical protein